MSIYTAEALQDCIEELIVMRDKLVKQFKKANRERRRSLFKRIDSFNGDIENLRIERNIAMRQVIADYGRIINGA
jgi:TolA-binding protein